MFKEKKFIGEIRKHKDINKSSEIIVDGLGEKEDRAV